MKFIHPVLRSGEGKAQTLEAQTPLLNNLKGNPRDQRSIGARPPGLPVYFSGVRGPDDCPKKLTSKVQQKCTAKSLNKCMFVLAYKLRDLDLQGMCPSQWMTASASLVMRRPLSCTW